MGVGAASRRADPDSLGAPTDNSVIPSGDPGHPVPQDGGVTAHELESSTKRLVRAVDALPDDAYAAPSLLPGWTRGHVVAHLALNAEGLTDALHSVGAGEPAAMYASPEARDTDIAALATAPPRQVRDRLLGSATTLAEAVRAMPADRGGVEVARTPGSDRTFRADEVVTMRWREVEIHHVDLDVGYRREAWPEAFAGLLVESVAARAPATLVATDLGRTWQGEDGAPTVSGTAADLGWWLSGRGGGDGLTSDGELPRIEAW